MRASVFVLLIFALSGRAQQTPDELREAEKRARALDALEKLGATILRGELGDRDLLRRGLEGADVVVHCAAKVGDWGPVEEYRAINVEALRGLLEVCKGRPLKRFVQEPDR